jgi:hypothetical protein
MIVYKYSNQCCGSGSGIESFFDHGSLDPGWKKIRTLIRGLGPGSHISESLVTIFGVKYSFFVIQCCWSGSGMEKNPDLDPRSWTGISYFREPSNNFWGKILILCHSVLLIRIRDGKSRSEIRDKHPGFATLTSTEAKCLFIMIQDRVRARTGSGLENYVNQKKSLFWIRHRARQFYIYFRFFRQKSSRKL